jgi:PST family polysaccharide transporter
MDEVAIGYGSGAAALGRYQNAMLIYENVLSVLTAPLHPVAVAGLCKVSNDPKEFRRLWGKAISTLSFWSMPAFGLLAVTSQGLILILLGKKWASAGILLSILALRGIPHAVERTLGWLHVPAGRSDRWMRWGVFALCAQGLALVSGLP